MSFRQRASKSQSGFTLMELLVVLVVIGLIAAVAVPQVMRLLEGAKSKAAKIQLETVGQSLHYYQLDMGRYPSDQQGLVALWQSPDDTPGWAGPYVRRAEQIKDPWGRGLIYASKGDGQAFTLATLGADGEEGGTGEDADLGYEE